MLALIDLVVLLLVAKIAAEVIGENILIAIVLVPLLTLAMTPILPKAGGSRFKKHSRTGAAG